MRKSRGFTLVELLVVIGIIALLISILMPALSKARRSANTVKCLSNLRQVGIGYQMYAADFKGAIPVVRQDLNDDGSQAPPTPSISTWWQDYVGTYIAKAKFNSNTATDLADARASVVWGCAEWLGRNAVMNQYDTGYGMNAQFSTTPNYPGPTTPTPKTEFAMRWTLNNTYLGKYYKLGSIRHSTERVLVADTVLWFLNARVSSGGGVAGLPGQPTDPSTTNASTVSTAGLMDYDLYRHTKPPKSNGTYFEKSGTVACNAVFVDGHAETITSLEQAYQGIFLKAP
jgi:prepilin-type N-terminal cleavage/methylation domain-containing protein/prepilin-type processing-associated H-X9-DG protein